MRIPEMTDDTEQLVCQDCGDSGPVHYFCDMVPVQVGPWCPKCFDKQPCLKEHDEGCATKVFG